MLHQRGRRALGSLLIAGMAASGCAADPPVVACADPDAPAANLDFTLQDMHGAEVTLRDFQGKVILLDFWATWCGPCKYEIPFFIELYDQYGDQGFQMLGLSVDDPVDTLLDYAERMNMNYPVLVGDGRDDIIEAYQPMPGLPTTFILDRAGHICESHTGLTEKEVFEEAIVGLL